MTDLACFGRRYTVSVAAASKDLTVKATVKTEMSISGSLMIGSSQSAGAGYEKNGMRGLAEVRYDDAVKVSDLRSAPEALQILEVVFIDPDRVHGTAGSKANHASLLR